MPSGDGPSAWPYVAAQRCVENERSTPCQAGDCRSRLASALLPARRFPAPAQRTGRNGAIYPMPSGNPGASARYPRRFLVGATGGRPYETVSLADMTEKVLVRETRHSNIRKWGQVTVMSGRSARFA